MQCPGARARLFLHRTFRPASPSIHLESHEEMPHPAHPVSQTPTKKPAFWDSQVPGMRPAHPVLQQEESIPGKAPGQANTGCQEAHPVLMQQRFQVPGQDLHKVQHRPAQPVSGTAAHPLLQQEEGLPGKVPCLATKSSQKAPCVDATKASGVRSGLAQGTAPTCTLRVRTATWVLGCTGHMSQDSASRVI